MGKDFPHTHTTKKKGKTGEEGEKKEAKGESHQR
jgi:hypothetical protein